MALSLPRAPLWPIVERHLDEAESLLDAWHEALDAPDYNLDGLVGDLEQRLWAHLDGLRIAGPDALARVIMPALEHADEPRAAAAALAALTVAPASEWEPLLALLGSDDGARTVARGVARGIALAESEAVDAWLQAQVSRLSTGDESLRLADLVRAMASRGRAPIELPRLLARPEPEVLAAAALAARHARDPQSAHALAMLVEHCDERVRVEAIESGLVRQLSSAWSAACRLGNEQLGTSELRRRALTWLALLGDAELHALLLARLASCTDPRLLADLLWAASLCGRPAALDCALPHLGDPELGPLAGEVFCAVAGIPSEDDDQALWRDRPRGPDDGLPPLELDDLDADLSLSSDDLLPMPEPVAVTRWWTQHRATLAGAPRLLAGRPWSPTVLLEQLHRGPLRRNHAFALELAVRSAGQIQLDTRFWAAQQLQTLRSAPVDAITLVRGLGLRDY